MITRKHKDHWKNWNVTTTVETPEIGERRFMRINTSKRHDGALTTMVSINQRGEDGYSYTHMMFQDFAKTVAVEKVRCTEKAVDKQHEDVLRHLASFKQLATEHYGKAVAA